MKLVFDCSSAMWTCLSVGVDPNGRQVENEDGKPFQVNTAEYGYDALLNHMTFVMAEFNVTPVDVILVFEGQNSKARRLMLDKDYKKNGTKRPVEAYEQFEKLKAMLKADFLALGAMALSQDGVESDDVIGWIAKNAKEATVISSGDWDLAVLSGVNEHGACIHTRIGKELNTNKYGVFPNKYISLYKAMVGDNGDSIKGIVGFGPAAWIEFHKEFGEEGMAEMVRLAELGSLAELEAEAQVNKMVAKIWEGRESFLKSWKLAKLHPEWVDTMQEALQWQPGMVLDTIPSNDKRLKQWCMQRMLVTSDNFDVVFARLKQLVSMRDYTALDIETSTPPESDEWLEAQEDPDGVDVIGSKLTGLSLTLGENMNRTVYLSFDHKDTANISRQQMLEVLLLLQQAGVELVIHNTSFEGVVLYEEFGKDLKDNGWNGFLANWLDTKIEASYVDENLKSGLKFRAQHHLNYSQTDYNTVTCLEGPVGSLEGCGGRFKGQFLKTVTGPVMSQTVVDGVPAEICVTPAVTETWERYQLKMNQLTAQHVFNYATDDTIVTASLHNFFKFLMQMEGTYSVYLETEIKASYTHAQSFHHGTKISLAKLREIEQDDEKDYATAWATVRNYLIKAGWEGTVTPVYTKDLTPAQIKEAHEIVAGERLVTQLRLLPKICALFERTQPALWHAVTAAIAGDPTDLNALVASRFQGEPEFNIGSPTQKAKLLYEVMGLPVRVYNKATDAMKASGQGVGNPKTDNLAIAYALQDAKEEEAEVLKALRVMQMVQTRKGLYYKPYPYFVHWKTGRVHSSHNQSSTNTRRASEAKPNRQQVSKHEKVEGYLPRVREVYVPHKPNAVIVSMDFKAQELRVIADYSRDTNMLACFIGENKKDMHALTGLGIFNHNQGVNWSYDQFVKVLEDKEDILFGVVKKARGRGKTTNFTTEFGAAAPKVAQVLMVTEEEAQVYIDAKLAAFPMVADWKAEVIAEAKLKGYVTTKCGARRHLRSLLLSPDRYISSKAERQAVNFKVQSSSAEMTKKAEGRMWDARLEQRFDCEIIGPIHDEVLASVTIADLWEFIPAMHACMVAPYGGMFVPIESSISFGPNFGQQVEIGDTPTAEAIRKGLEELVKDGLLPEKVLA